MSADQTKARWLNWRPVVDETQDNVLLLFTIHQPPPGRKHYLIRRWRVAGHKITPDPDKPLRAPDLVTARSYVPPNKMWCKGALLKDDPTVLESWI